MKLPAILLAGTLALNAALFATMALRPSSDSGSLRIGRDSSRTATGAAAVGRGAQSSGNSAPRSGNGASGGQSANAWDALDSADLRQLAARLQAAGFPPPMIRAIITSRIDALFAPRMKELIASVDNTPIWKQDPRSSLSAKMAEGRSQVMLERTRMLRDVLGGDLSAWTDDPEAARRRQFGAVSPEKIELVQRISEDYAEMASQVRASMQGITLPEDREKLALLEREKHADLAAILDQKELEEYEMRTSQVTSRLGPALTVMDANEEEFRTLFRIYSTFNDRINPIVGAGIVALGANTVTQRRDATNEMMAQIKAALPPERYADYVRAQDREFQQLHNIARQNNVPPETAIRAFNLRDQYSAESNRIIDDRALSQDQKRTALQNLGAEARNQIIGTLGQSAGSTYIQSSNWLGAIDAGRAFTIISGGGMSQRGPSITPATKN